MTGLLHTFLYYFSFSSIVLVYGVGLKHIAVNSFSAAFLSSYMLKNAAITLLSSVICRLITVFLLLPFSLAEVFPLAVILIVAGLSYVYELLTHTCEKNSPGEMLISALCVILAVNESVSYSQTLFIAATCTVSVFTVLTFLYAINLRIQSAQPPKPVVPAGVLIFLSIAFILLALLGWNFSWLNTELLN